MKKNIIRLTPKIIFEQLCNLSQIVFEVTDACNLECSYCGYGELYQGRDERKAKNLSFDSAVSVIDYMMDIWQNNPHISANQRVFISFYGGEPLMNMPLVEKVVEYVEQLPYTDRSFVFSMTTNAVLLPRYMNYLAEKKVHVLISLDGDEKSHSYRVDHKGDNSFKKVFENIKLLHNTFPEYFKECISFNSVIHDRNSVGEVMCFIKEHFDKDTSVSSLNNSNIADDKADDFNKLYRDLMGSIKSKEELERLIDESFLSIPLVNELMHDIFRNSGNVFRNYNDLLYGKNTNVIPTGTCLPFGKKLFLTVNDKILVCERIPQHFVAGKVANGKVYIDLEKIAETYNSYYKKIDKQCRICSSLGNCTQCIFQMDDILSKKPVCRSFVSNEQLITSKLRLKSFLSEYPHLYRRIMDEVILS